jgi:hypothetical protein
MAAAPKIDPHQLLPRLLNEVSVLLGDLAKYRKEITIKERTQCISTISRVIYLAIRKDGSEEQSGAAVRKYSTVFTSPSNAARGRKGNTRSAAGIDDELDREFDREFEDDDGRGAA